MSDSTSEMVVSGSSLSNEIGNLNPQSDFFENMKSLMLLGQQQILVTQQALGDLASSVRTEVKKFNNKLDNMQSKVEDVESKVEDVTESVENINSRLDTILKTGNGGRFTTPEGQKLYPLLPYMFNGERGICGWVPVDFTDDDGTDHSVVVLSVRMTEYIMTETASMGYLKNYIPNFLRSFSRFNDGRKPSMNEFIRIMIRTPFKCYVLGKNGRTFTFKNNEDNYILMDAEYWKKLMNDIVAFFPDASKTIPVPEKKIPMNAMTQRWSLVATSGKDSRTPAISNLMDCRLSFDERMHMPACGVPWWREAYESGAAKYFGMPMENQGQELKHVVNGVYCSEGEWVRTFDETLSVLQEFDESSSDEEDEEVVCDKKGKGKRRAKSNKGGARKKRSTEVDMLGR